LYWLGTEQLGVFIRQLADEVLELTGRDRRFDRGHGRPGMAAGVPLAAPVALPIGHPAVELLEAEPLSPALTGDHPGQRGWQLAGEIARFPTGEPLPQHGQGGANRLLGVLDGVGTGGST
jgi:hypothetical protein